MEKLIDFSIKYYPDIIRSFASYLKDNKSNIRSIAPLDDFIFASIFGQFTLDVYNIVVYNVYSEQGDLIALKFCTFTVNGINSTITTVKRIDYVQATYRSDIVKTLLFIIQSNNIIEKEPF